MGDIIGKKKVFAYCIYANGVSKKLKDLPWFLDPHSSASNHLPLGLLPKAQGCVYGDP